MSPDSLPSQVSSHIEQLESRAVDGFRNNDASVMEELHDEDCIGVGILGSQYAKKEFVEAFRNQLSVQAIKLLSTRTVVEGSFAVVLSNWDVNMSLGPAIFEGRVRVTRTWVKRPAGWKIISFHFSDARLATTWEKLRSAK